MLDHARLVTLWLAMAMFCFLGCKNRYSEHGQSEKPCAGIVPAERLPAGWRLLPTSEMPPSDKMPWWTNNPLKLEGSAAKALDIDGQEVSASRVQAAMYEKEDKYAMILCLTYPTQEAATWVYNHIQEQPASIEERLVAFSRTLSNTLIVLSLDPECPDRSFFVGHFNAMTGGEQANQTPPTTKRPEPALGCIRPSRQGA